MTRAPAWAAPHTAVRAASKPARAPEPPRGPARPDRPRWSLAAVVVVVAIASLPLLVPAGLPPGPGNTGIPDLLLVALLLTTVLWAGSGGYALYWPFLVPTLLTLIAGGLSAIVMGAGALTLAKDLFVLFWAVAIANLGRETRLLTTAFKAWAYIGTGYAAILIFSYVAGIDAISGQTAVGGARSNFTFGDANYASNYFICTFFVLRAAQVPRRPPARYACCAILLTAEILTGSNGGALALGCALIAGYLIRLVREGKAQQAVAAAALLGLAAGGVAIVLGQTDYRAGIARLSEYSPILRDSVGRITGESSNSRGAVLSESTKLLVHQRHPLVGIGPGQTETQMRVGQAPYVREAHNDYVAAVLERGVLGGFALVVLLAALLLRCVRISRRGALAPEYAAIVPRPELLGAMVLAMLVSSFFYETLHYRHGWALFGLIAALEIWGVRAGKGVRP
ncbi:MAG: O-antigen ligase family protein [Streptosporangiaceae bacterium]|nr:O-antigen ligase family protein [Streptosporangiaceae bacterium]